MVNISRKLFVKEPRSFRAISFLSLKKGVTKSVVWSLPRHCFLKYHLEKIGVLAICSQCEEKTVLRLQFWYR